MKLALFSTGLVPRMAIWLPGSENISSNIQASFRHCPPILSASLNSGCARYRLDHIVGSDPTQIFSVREAGNRVATLELLISGEPGDQLSIRAGQFKSHHNGKPPPRAQQILAAFLKDLRDGRHPIARSEIAQYRKRARRVGDYAWRSDAMPLDHARRVWPFYRALLPKDAPAEFDAWCHWRGLSNAIDGMLLAIAGRPSAPAFQRIASTGAKS